ncbi:MAG: CYTH domain-containing protein [Myxococcales bacterium]|nr:CYTH domain-containing protein [Myxococcales bacterium]
MGIEIERKFLVTSDAWRGGAVPTLLRQGYLSTDPERVVRARVAAERGFLTVKGRAAGARRVEIEVELPLEEARAALALCKGTLIEKHRHRVAHGAFTFEVDEFLGANAGLVVAELEVADERAFERALASPPGWLGQDVTDDMRLTNSALSERPFDQWTEAERAAVSKPVSQR